MIDLVSEHRAEIGALAPWFGSKRILAPRIVAELGPHTSYWEPFCGSMAPLLAKPPAAMETVNDLHGDLVNLARVIQHPVLGPKLYRRSRRTLAAKALMDDAAARWAARGHAPAGDALDLDRACDYFASSWLGRNGVSGTDSYNQGFSRRFTKSGGHAAKRWANAVASIPAWRRRFRMVVILSECGISLVERIEDAPGVVIYLDPPYIEKGASYVHDFGPAEHERLAIAARRFRKTRVVISYYDHPMVRELYSGWTFVDCTMTKALVNQGRWNKKAVEKAPEVLIINGPSYTQSEKAPLFTRRGSF